MKSLCILGRQPAIGLAELESLFGNDSVQPVDQLAALVSVEPEELPFSRLGGSIKAAKVLNSLDTTKWQDIESFLKKLVPTHLQFVPEGKLKLGISTYGLPINARQINNTALALKKIARSLGRNIRVVPNKDTFLNTAQIRHNNLTGQKGWELLLVRYGNATILAQTFAVQDIDAYAARDQARPKRDARVGMLPPKLAQIIINLATGQIGATVDQQSAKSALDPFCGTGVILQEALLMGYSVYGTDIEPKMVEYAQTNLDWLGTSYRLRSGAFHLEVADATRQLWVPFPEFIACETYLGQPFSAPPKPEILKEVIKNVDTIHRKFLQNVARQTSAGFRMCVAIPAWRTKGGFRHLPILDSLTQLGYTRESFVYANDKDLIYNRPDQIVGRELVTLIRN